MNTDSITHCACQVVRLLDDYSNGPNREMRVDPVLYGYLHAKFGKVSRQHYVHFTGSTKPSRIDFRIGTSNPALIEFVVCPKQGGGHLYGSQNKSELRKLVRASQAKAKLRILLLVDLSPTGIERADLKRTYDPINAGRGKFDRHSVRVIYVHRSRHYNFIWRPWSQ